MLIYVISTNRYRFTVGNAAAHRNGDHHPVGEGHGQRAAGHRVADTGGVDNAAALDHGLAVGGRAQGHGGSVYSVDHVGGHLAAGVQLFIVATAAAGDTHRQAAAIFVNVVTRGIDRHTAAQLTRLDGDAGAVGQGQHQVTLRGVVDVGTVGDLPTFVDLRRSTQGHGGGVDSVVNLGSR